MSLKNGHVNLCIKHHTREWPALWREGDRSVVRCNLCKTEATGENIGEAVLKWNMIQEGIAA